MAEVKFACKYRIQPNGDMDILMVQTHPIAKQVKLREVGGVMMLRPKVPKELPIKDALVMRIPANLISQFLGSISLITQDYAGKVKEAVDIIEKRNEENEQA
jgi:hypothetical protein